MSRPLIFVGSRTGLADLACTADELGIEILGILDHQYYGNTDCIDSIPVIGDDRWLLDSTNQQAQSWRDHCDFFVASYHHGQQQSPEDGSNAERLRYERVNLVDQAQVNVINLISPRANLIGATSRYGSVRLGRGIYISSSASFGCKDIVINDHCVIGDETNISHHTHLGRNTLIGPYCHLWETQIGPNTYIGLDSQTSFLRSKKSQIIIGGFCTVWGHSRIDRDVPDNHVLTHQGRVLRKYRSLSWASSNLQDQG